MSVESDDDLQGLLHIGRIVRLTLETMREQLRPGMTTKQLDTIGWEVLKQYGAHSAPVVTYQFPGITCISVNEEAAHGIPGRRVIRAGDLVKIDVSAELNGYFGDACITVPVPPVSPSNQRLCDCARAACEAAIAVAHANVAINEIGRAAELTTRRQGFQVIHELPGHGVGRALHEEPFNIANYYRPRARQRLTDGLVITIEPHIATGSGQIFTAGDGWTLKTRDGGFAAAYEHTVIITGDRPILTTA